MACQELSELKARSPGYEAQGFYQLPGRNEIAFAVQQQLLPCFGFEASKGGVSDMIAQCAVHLTDPEVAKHFDAVNATPGRDEVGGRLGLIISYSAVLLEVP